MTTPVASLPHEASTWTRKLPTWNHRSKRVALDPHSCSKLAAQLVARPSENIACDRLLCIGKDRSGELQKVECCFAASVGLPTRTVIDGGRTHHVACNMARTSAPSTNTLEIDVFGCSAEGSTRPVFCQITLCWTWNQSDVEEKCKCASPCTTLK